jgi:hypothetical protein
MPEPTDSQTQVTVPGLRDVRRNRSNARRERLAADGTGVARQQAIQTLFASTLTKAGFDLDTFEALQQEHQAAMRARIAQRRAEADERSSALLEATPRDVENWRQTIEHLTALAPAAAPGPFVYLTTASEILATPGITLASTHIEPQNNWAQFHLETTDDAIDEVTCRFVWQNPSDKYAVVNVNGYLVLNGIVEAIAHGGFWSDARTSYARLDAVLRISELWNRPPTSPLLQAGQDQKVLELSANASGFWDLGEIAYEEVSKGFLLQYSQFVLPPHGTAAFDLGCWLQYGSTDGEANYVFLERGHEVLAVGVLIDVLS